MPKFLERALRKSAAAAGKEGKAADRYVYGAMNNMGAMHGNQETAKGRAMERKHESQGSARNRMAGSHDGMFVTEHHRGSKRRR